MNQRDVAWAASLLLFAVGCVAGCGTFSARLVLPGEKGLASWYGEEYHGRTTASGERFDQWAMTAAHRTLPFDSVVRVKNLKNGKQAKVRINDRGPFVRGRIIDVSRGAATRLDMIRDGVVPVRVKVLKKGDG